MDRIQGEIIIHRAIGDVFDFVADGRNEPQYNPHVSEVEKTSVGPIGRGTQFRLHTKTMGPPSEVAYEFTAYERPRRLESRVIHSPLMDLQGTETFDDVAGATRFRWSFEVQGRGPFKLASFVVARVLGRRLDEAFGTMKRLLEADGTRQSSASRG